MENSSKKLWLLGGIVAVLVIVGLAVALNQGGLFRGALLDLRTAAPEKSIDANVGRVLLTDYQTQATEAGQKLDTVLFQVTDKEGNTYDVKGDASLSGYINAQNGVNFDVSNIDFKDIYLKLEEKTSLRQVAPDVLQPVQPDYIPPVIMQQAPLLFPEQQINMQVNELRQIENTMVPAADFQKSINVTPTLDMQPSLNTAPVLDNYIQAPSLNLRSTVPMARAAALTDSGISGQRIAQLDAIRIPLPATSSLTPSVVNDNMGSRQTTLDPLSALAVTKTYTLDSNNIFKIPDIKTSLGTGKYEIQLNDANGELVRFPMRVVDSSAEKVQIPTIPVKPEQPITPILPLEVPDEIQPPLIEDADHDEIADAEDNCPQDVNTDQLDSDQDGIGDVCDPVDDIKAAADKAAEDAAAKAAADKAAEDAAAKAAADKAAAEAALNAPTATYNYSYNYYTNPEQKAATNVTQPTTTPCVVADQTFYLAGGPGSTYCKDLQTLVSKTTGKQEVFKSDLTPETPQARYTTALATLRILKELGGNIRTRNLATDWYSKLNDASDLQAASTQELTDFRTVYASGVLNGRVNPKDKTQVTLAPLGKISYIELMAMFRQSIVNSLGVTVEINEANLPDYILTQYKSNPDWQWIAESYSFGVDYGLISKSEFNETTLFNYATRADMVRFLARFQDSVTANPSLIKP